jgi:parvulin-like peptidyl-prolyl isomerase
VLISKFHKLIGNKWLWAVFAILISLAFVGLFTPGINSGETEQLTAAGKLYGQDISKTEYNIAEYFEKGLVNDKNYDEQEYNELQNKTWQRIAALKTAERMGVTVTDEEVINAIRNDRTFSNSTGQFDKRIFNQILSQIRLSPEIYTEYVQQQLIIYKVKQHLESQVWMPPTLIEEKLSDLTDMITVKAGLISNISFTNDVKITDELIETYYNENKEYFETPEKISVKYIKWGTDDISKNVEVSDVQAGNYYTNYIDDFSVADTNDNLVPISFEKVKNKVVKTIQNKEALNQLIDTASDFIRKLEPIGDETIVFETLVAQETDLSVTTTKLFAATSPNTVGLDDLKKNDIQMLMSLNKEDPWRCFSDPVVTDDAVYVFVANDKVEPKIPELEDVKAQVADYVRQDELAKYSKIKAEEAVEKIVKEVAEEKSFSAVAKSLNIETFNAGTFVPYQGITNDVLYAEEISRSVISVKQGEASEPISIPSGALLAFVEKRVEGDPFEKELVRPQLLSSLTKYRADITYPQWCENILKSKDAHFVNFLNKPKQDADVEKEMEDEETGI